MEQATITSRELREEVEQLRARYDEEPSHSQQVEKLATQLFDELAMQRAEPIISPRDRVLLETAALLHDIGWSQTADGKGHHKYSAKLIRRQAWSTLDPEEIEIVALVARYHRKSLPKASHQEFIALTGQNKRRVRFLAGVLRVADGLDRTHSSVVLEVGCQLKETEMTVLVKTARPWEEERRMFLEKKDLLELALERSVRVSEMGLGKANSH